MYKQWKTVGGTVVRWIASIFKSYFAPKIHDNIFNLVFSFVSEGHHVMTASAPHAGVALITALNILEGYNITGQLPRNSTYHWIAEVVY